MAWVVPARGALRGPSRRGPAVSHNIPSCALAGGSGPGLRPRPRGRIHHRSVRPKQYAPRAARPAHWAAGARAVFLPHHVLEAHPGLALGPTPPHPRPRGSSPASFRRCARKGLPWPPVHSAAPSPRGVRRLPSVPASTALHCGPLGASPRSAGPRSVTTHLKTRLTQRRRRPGVLRSRERRLHLATRARIRAKVQLLRGQWEYNASVASFTVEARKDLAATLTDRCRIYIDINIYMKHLPRNVKDQNKLKFCLRR